MDADFVQNVVMAAVALATAVFGLFKYFKTGDDEKKPATDTESGTVLAASFLDSRVLKELIEAIRSGSEEYAKEGRKLARTRTELVTALEESTDALLANTDALVNMVRFMKRQESKTPDNDTE